MNATNQLPDPPKCDACRRPIPVQDSGLALQYDTTHVAIGGQTETQPKDSAFDWDVDWDPSSEYDLCDECGESWHDQFNAWMQGRKAWGVRHGAR